MKTVYKVQNIGVNQLKRPTNAMRLNIAYKQSGQHTIDIWSKTEMLTWPFQTNVQIVSNA